MFLLAHVLCMHYLWNAVSGECKNSVPIFELQATKSSSITIFYNFPHGVEEEEIFLYHNHENFSCRSHGNINGTCFANHILNTSYHENSCGNATKQCYFELQVNATGYYCGYMIISDCIYTYYTPTIHFNLSSNVDLQEDITQQNSSRQLLWILSIIGLILCILSYIIYKRIRHNLQSNPNPGPNSCNLSNYVQLEPYLYEPLSKTVQMFVLYHRDDDEHFGRVQTFVSLIQKLPNCEIVVDYKCRSEICRLGMATWVNNMLQASHRIVIISSEGAYAKVKLRNNFKITSTDPIDLETAFLCGWVMILSDLSLVSNYKKLFNIRFEQTDSKFLLPFVVSGRHFKIPCHYNNLVFQLLGSKEIANEFESVVKLRME